MKNMRKTASMTRVLFTTHIEILLTYCRVVAVPVGSVGGEEKAQVMKKENNPGKRKYVFPKL